MGLPFIVLYAFVIGVLLWYLLEWTPLGIEARILDGKRKAAIANGLNVRRLDTVLYVAAGRQQASPASYAARVGNGQVAVGGAPVTLSGARQL